MSVSRGIGNPGSTAKPAILGKLRNIDKIVGAFFLISLVSMTIFQVVMRYFFSRPVTGTEELGRYFLIWIIFISAPYSARMGSFIKMEELQAILPKKMGRAINIAACIFSIGVFAVISASAVSTVSHNLKLTTPSLGIPFLPFFLPTMAGFILLTVEHIILLIANLKSGRE